MTTLTLDAPGAVAALARCYSLLIQWANEAADGKAAGSLTDSQAQGESAAGGGPTEAGHRRHANTMPQAGQTGEV